MIIFSKKHVLNVNFLAYFVNIKIISVFRVYKANSGKIPQHVNVWKVIIKWITKEIAKNVLLDANPV